MVRIGAGLAVAAIAILFFLIWLTTPSAGQGQLLLPTRTPFTKGSYFAYAQPWGGDESRLTRPWGTHSDKILIDVKQFPSNTRLRWRWPPFLPLNDVGVWGYNSVMYGNYDGGEPEKPVAPVRVSDLKQLRETFSWSMKDFFGDANALTEFYLYSTATKSAVHTIEIGWFLHAPRSTRRYFEAQKLIGIYTDDRGRRWAVRMEGQFCMFAPEKPGDLTAGTIDVLHALRWLQSKGMITGKEWFWGLAMGIEPLRGLGTMDIHRWNVVMN